MMAVMTAFNPAFSTLNAMIHPITDTTAERGSRRTMESNEVGRYHHQDHGYRARPSAT